MILVYVLVAFVLGSLAGVYAFRRSPRAETVTVPEPLPSGLKAEIAALQKDVMDLRVVVATGTKDYNRHRSEIVSLLTSVAEELETQRELTLNAGKQTAALAGQIEKTGKDITHTLGLEAEAATIRLRRDVEGAAVATAAFVDSAITKLGAVVAGLNAQAESASVLVKEACHHAGAASEHVLALTDLTAGARRDVAEMASAPGHVKAAVQEIAALRQRVAKTADEVESEMALIAKMAVSETAKQAASAAANIDGLRKRASVVSSGKDPIVVPPVKIIYVNGRGGIIGEEIIPKNQRRPTRTFNGKAYVASEELRPDEWIYVRG